MPPKYAFHSDWHIHTAGSYDVRKNSKGTNLFISSIVNEAKSQGITRFGISDHVNDNSSSFYSDLKVSRDLYDKNNIEGLYFGVEITPIPETHYQSVQKNDKSEGYLHNQAKYNDEIILVLNYEQISKNKINYVIAGVHGAVRNIDISLSNVIKEYHEYQMILASDTRVNIVAHSWWWNKGWWWNESMGNMWGEDFSIIPYSMHDEYAEALIKNDCCAEFNPHMVTGNAYSELYIDQYC